MHAGVIEAVDSGYSGLDELDARSLVWVFGQHARERQGFADGALNEDAGAGLKGLKEAVLPAHARSNTAAMP
jgi:hypothetical protein